MSDLDLDFGVFSEIFDDEYADGVIKVNYLNKLEKLLERIEKNDPTLPFANIGSAISFINEIIALITQIQVSGGNPRLLQELKLKLQHVLEKALLGQRKFYLEKESRRKKITKSSRDNLFKVRNKGASAKGETKSKAKIEHLSDAMRKKARALIVGLVRAIDKYDDVSKQYNAAKSKVDLIRLARGLEQGGGYKGVKSLIANDKNPSSNAGDAKAFSTLSKVRVERENVRTEVQRLIFRVCAFFAVAGILMARKSSELDMSNTETMGVKGGS